MKDNIPGVFWYSVSCCLIIATGVLSYVALKSSSVSIEIANTKISLLSAVKETQEIADKLKNTSNSPNSCEDIENSPLESFGHSTSQTPEIELLQKCLMKLEQRILK